MNRQIGRVGVGMIVLFLALFIQLNVLQVLRAEEYANHPGNTRTAVRDFSKPRGQIVSADGAVLARSVPTSGAFERQREYPEKELFGHITGFFSFTFGASGIERRYNDALSGRQLDITSLKDALVARTVTGDVHITLSKGLQTIAKNALGDKKGAVVAVDATNGAVLAMWSFPSYDPSPLSAHDQKAVQSAWKSRTENPDNPDRARSFQRTYPPGSTFKVITSAAAYERKPELASKDYPRLRELDLPLTNRTLPNFGGGTCGGVLPDLLRVSCNTGFAQMGLDMGAEALVGEAEDFGFNSRPPLDLTAVSESAIPKPNAFVRNEPALAQSAIGQRDVRATPLQMALVAAGVVNGGTIMEPHVLNQIHDSDGNVVRTHEAEVWKTPLASDVANQLRDLMVNVVERGTGTRAKVAGALVGGKTGTAQTVGDNAHAWFIGFGDGNGRKVAVSVIVESQPGVSEATGGRVAAPIAQQVLKAALGL